METTKQLDIQNIINNLKNLKSKEGNVQFNISISKVSKKKFMQFCLEQDLNVKYAAEFALLDFINKCTDNGSLENTLDEMRTLHDK